ncbi:19506_t:CDS:2, partial [Racocetra persica]
MSSYRLHVAHFLRKKKIITIINGEEFNIELDEFYSLQELRKILVSNKGILIDWRNAHFIDTAKEKISHDREDLYKAKDILVQDDDYYALYIEVNAPIPNMPEIIKKFKIDKGYILDNGTIVAANKQAFYIDDISINVKDTYNPSDEVEGSKVISSNECKLYYAEKAAILLSHENLKLTKEYYYAIKNIICQKHWSDTEKIDALNKIGEDYGFFWPREIMLDGKIMQFIDSKSQLQHRVLGGDILMSENKKDWLQHLKPYKNWEIIGYNNRISLYELLDENLQREIKRLFGMKVYHLDALSINKTIPVTGLYYRIPKPPKITSFGDHKIFASIINKTSSVFAIRVDYPDPEKPHFVIHRIDAGNEDSSPVNLLIPWMIIGFIDKFPTESYSISYPRIDLCTYDYDYHDSIKNIFEDDDYDYHDSIKNNIEDDYDYDPKSNITRIKKNIKTDNSYDNYNNNGDNFTVYCNNNNCSVYYNYSYSDINSYNDNYRDTDNYSDGIDIDYKDKDFSEHVSKFDRCKDKI